MRHGSVDERAMIAMLLLLPVPGKPYLFACKSKNLKTHFLTLIVNYRSYQIHAIKNSKLAI